MTPSFILYNGKGAIKILSDKIFIRVLWTLNAPEMLNANLFKLTNQG